MPPANRKKLRCAYMEHNRRCQRTATGNPPLCEAHRLVLEDQARGDNSKDVLSNIFADLITGRRVSEDRWRGGMEEFARLFQQAPADSWVGSRRDRVADAVRSRVERATRRPSEGQRKPPTPPPPPKKPSGPSPRVILGFTDREPLTLEMVKRRHRELARLHHPDRGGSVERMQQINAAADALIATIG